MSKKTLIGAAIAAVAAASAAFAAAYADGVVSPDELIQVAVTAVTAVIAYIKKPAA